jgi:hypothetical protein
MPFDRPRLRRFRSEASVKAAHRLQVIGSPMPKGGFNSMAQMQPNDRGMVKGLNDVSYDLVTTLANCSEGIDVLDAYIEDAKLENSPDVQQAFELIRNDEIRHCEMLRNLILGRATQGIF